MKRNLTDRQKLFIVEYLECKNAARAARNAGYSIRTARAAGHRLLTNVDIKRVVEIGIAAQLDRAEISADRYIAELRRLAFTEPGERGSGAKLKAIELLGRSLGLFRKNPRGESKHEISASMLLG